ncbi:hypothetical protein P153DRAFT_381368 [Dothidotthia symphoricarpi CBS 119687]|uniref:SAP domain-containing protein n=1 Tax=Dothidotthia symphoricarpi CBS 119687 TaxID=1392245 RepID=A0A6A6ATM8_9PLEO|nr:uncharacterized protein P153DRAFT_381368 [Dothidotthia symphoricarpi CBS 119687]KAF2134187.1 hypothetical protein P153DRAFT_381368 [Dothidotthia symphoricarpi CBS 119687]
MSTPNTDSTSTSTSESTSPPTYQSQPTSHTQDAITDLDAAGINEAEDERQYRAHWQQQYEAKGIMELRELCRGEGVKIRGSKAELVSRLVRIEVEGYRGRGYGG